MGLTDYDAFPKAAVEHPKRYWDETLRQFGIVFDPPPTTFMEAREGPL